MKKRIISGLLAIAMMFSLIPVPVSAAVTESGSFTLSSTVIEGYRCAETYWGYSGWADFRVFTDGENYYFCANFDRIHEDGGTYSTDGTLYSTGNYLLAAKIQYILDTVDYGLTYYQKLWILQKFIWANDLFGLQSNGTTDEDDWVLYYETESYATIGLADELYDTVIAAAKAADDVTGGCYLYTCNSAQELVGIVYEEVQKTGYLDIKKESANTDITSGNSCYSLEGAEYTVYTDSGCSAAAKDTDGNEAVFVLDSSGNAGAMELEAGTYYVKETNAAEGYGLNETVYTAVVSAGEIAWVNTEAVYDEPVSDQVGIILKKINSSTGDTINLSGAVYKISFYGSYTVSGSAKRVWYFETDSNGCISVSEEYFSDSYSSDELYCSGGAAVLPLGSITVQEIKAPDGFLLDDTVYSAVVTEDGIIWDDDSTGTIAATNEAGEQYVLHYETPVLGGVKFGKIDADRDAAVPQGDATLEGAEITVYNSSGSSVYIDSAYVGTEKTESGTEILPDANGDGYYESGEAVLVLVTDEDGIATTDGDGDGYSYILPYGSYSAAETKASAGYLLNEDWSVSFTVTENGEVVDKTGSGSELDESVQRGGIELQKCDGETTLAEALGAATLGGFVYEIVNVSGEAVYVPEELVEESSLIEYTEDSDGDGWYENGETILLITTDENGIATTDGDGNGICRTLPCGTYRVTETEAGEGYLLEGILSRIYSLNEDSEGGFTDGQIVTSDDAGYFSDMVIRGDFRFRKIVSDTQAELAGVLFQITSDTTGETHYFVTDENGEFNSSWDYTSHTTENANGNDSAVSATGTAYGSVIKTEDADGNTIYVDTSLLNSAYGIWFGEGTDPDYSLSALPYDTYTITEIATDVNAAYTMRQFKLTISEKDDGSGISGDAEGAEAEEISIDLGNIENNDISVQTQVSCGTDGTQFAAAAEDVYITDDVIITGTLEGQTFIITAVLMDGETGLAYTDVNGNTYTETLTVYAKDDYVSKSVEFDSVDLTGMEGRSLVVYVYVYDESGERLMAEEASLSERAETIYVPGIETEALDAENGLHMSDTEDSIEITDTITYTNVAWAGRYTVTGVLYYAEDFTDAEGTVHYAGDPVLDPDGDYITARASFTANAAGGAERTYAADGEVAVANGTVTITFTVDSSLLDGAVVVAYEYLSYRSGDLLAREEDIANEEQTIRFPKIKTSAFDTLTGDGAGTAVTDTCIMDTVFYENIIIGCTYKLVASVIDYSDESVLICSGSTEFTPQEASGTVVVSIEGVTAKQGDTYVVYEVLYVKGTDGEWHAVSAHREKDDESQTIHYPDISTCAADILTGDGAGTAASSADVVDTVSFENVIPGMEYTITGTLYDQESGDVLTINGKSFTQNTVFTVYADGTISVSEGEEGIVISVDEDGCAASGTVTVTFTGIDSTVLAGGSVVVYEVLSHNGTDVARHCDIADEAQTVHYPYIDTLAYDFCSGSHAGTVFGNLINDIRSLLGFEDADNDGTADCVQENLIDTVALSNLVPGCTYTLAGTLYDEDTGEVYIQNGEKVTASVTFTVSESGEGIIVLSGKADSAKVTACDSNLNSTDAEISLAFSVDTSLLAGATLVVYESLYHNDIEVIFHSDITDEDQSVYYPDISTTLTDTVDGDHDALAAEKIELVDVVAYENFIAGSEYTITGVLYDKETGEPALDDNGNEITAETTFTAQEENGTVEVTFAFSGVSLAGHSLVAFETLIYQETELITHADIDDESQTVYIPDGGTVLVNSQTGTKDVYISEEITLTDTVYYENLIVGKTYTVSGLLVDKETGEALLDDDGNEITSEVTFTTEAESGTVEAEFTFPGTTLEGKTAVAFETVYNENGKTVFAHTDTEDEDQSVTIEAPEEAENVQTGDDDGMRPWVLAMLAALALPAAPAAVLLKKRRKKA